MLRHTFDMTTVMRRQYTRSELLNLRNNFPITRRQRRALWFYKLLRPPAKSHTSVGQQVLPPFSAPVTSYNSSDSAPADPTTQANKLRKSSCPSLTAPSILLFNARSVFYKIDELKIRILKYDPDIVCVTESWLDDSVDNNAICIPGYQILRQDRNSNGGGVIVFLKSNFSFTIVNNSLPPTLNSNLLCCEIGILDLTLTVVYHPYWGKTASHDMLLDHIQNLIDNSCNRHFLVVGDVNDLRLSLDDFCIYNSLQQIVTQPTRGSNILDVILTNQANLFETPFCTAPLGRSDHKGVFVKGSIKKPVTVTKVKVRSFSPSSFALCCHYLGSVDWQTFFNIIGDIDEMVDSFQEYLRFCYETFFPLKTVRMRSCDPPWLSPSLKTLSDAKDKALNRGNFQKYVQLRERFSKEVFKAKTKHLTRNSSNTTSDNWNSIKAQICTSAKPLQPINDSLASRLNDDFASHFSPKDIDRFYDKRPNLPVQIPEVTELQIVNMIKRSKSNSIGPDGIPGHFFRLFAEFISFPLSIIYNLCLKSSVFPRPWKLANVIPLPKNSNEYRPISILPFLSKLLERLIRDLILTPSLSHELDPRQFGFVSGGYGGCSNALLSLRLTILQHISLHPDNSARILAIDFKKAFDSVSHKILLNSLIDNFHCNPFVINTIRNFLTDRLQRVASQDYTSPWKFITSGVPQGSVLGPILFILLIDDFPSLKNTKVVAYADDISLIHLIDRDSDVDFQSVVDDFMSWSNEKKLSVNVNKTKCMYVTRKHLSVSPSTIVINGIPIEEVTTVKILGVVFSADLRWDAEFSNLYKTCCRSMSIVKRLQVNNNNSSVIWQAYTGLVFCHMAFRWPVICDLSVKFYRKLERLHNVACRWAKKMEKPSLRAMLNKICLKLIRKIARDKNAHPLSQFFVIRDINRPTRHTRTLLPLHRKSALYNNSFVKFSSFS